MIKKNAISLKTAVEWAKNWRSKESSYNRHNECKAFNIPKVDLQEVLSEKNVHSVRAYLGVNEKGVEKLMIVGVNKEGKDILPSENTKLRDGDEGGIYDFTEPCPSTCDDGSSLNG